MSELTDYDRSELKPVECAQHRLLWMERLTSKAQRKAWALWLLRILPAAVAVVSGLVGVWTMVQHGAK